MRKCSTKLLDFYKRSQRTENTYRCQRIILVTKGAVGIEVIAMIRMHVFAPLPKMPGLAKAYKGMVLEQPVEPDTSLRTLFSELSTRIKTLCEQAVGLTTATSTLREALVMEVRYEALITDLCSSRLNSWIGSATTDWRYL